MNHTGERHLDGMVGGKSFLSHLDFAQFGLLTGQGGSSGYEEGLMRPDLLIVEAGRSQVINPKRRDREVALLGE